MASKHDNFENGEPTPPEKWNLIQKMLYPKSFVQINSSASKRPNTRFQPILINIVNVISIVLFDIFFRLLTFYVTYCHQKKVLASSLFRSIEHFIVYVMFLDHFRNIHLPTYDSIFWMV